MTALEVDPIPVQTEPHGEAERPTAFMLTPVRQRQALTVAVYVVAVAAAAFDAGVFWPFVIGAHVFVAIALFAALGGGVSAVPVVGTCLVALLTMLASDRLAVGSLASVVFAFVVGELLISCRNARLHTGWRPRPLPDAVVPVAALATVGVVVPLIVSALPGARFLGGTAALGLGVLAFLTLRARPAPQPVGGDATAPMLPPAPLVPPSTLPPAPLPPPSVPSLGSDRRVAPLPPPPPPPPPPWSERR